MRKTIKGALMTAGLTLLMGLSLNVNQPAKVTAATEAITFSLNKGTGVSGTTYVTNSPAFTISGTGFVANNFNPNTGQVRGSGNVTTNFLMYNTTALPGRLVSIEMTFNSTNKDTSGTGRNALSVGNAVITSGSAQIPITTQTYTNYTWIVPTGTDGTFFHLYNFESSGTVLNTGITITYEVGGGGPVNPTGLTINGDSSVTAGQTITLSVTAAPEGSMDAVSWESSNDNIATINQEGVVAGIAEGDATITATSIYDTNVYATHVVSVLPRGEGPQEYYVDITRDNFPSGNLAYTTPSKWTATGNDGTPLEGYASVTTNATQIQTNQSGTREPFRNSTPLPGPLVRVELNLAQGTPRTHTIYVSTDTEITNANYTTAGTNVGTITPTGSLEVSSAADYRYFNFRSVSSASYLSSIRVTYLIIPVAQVPVASIGITGSDSVEIGATIGLSATVLPEDATNKNVTWSTSNASVATVDAATGVVTGVSQGTANIYATATDGSNVVSPAHAITVTTVNYNAAEAVMEALDALYEKVVNETLTLLDEADFQTIMGDYDSLSSIQKTYFDEYDSGYYLSVIDEIEAAFQALHDDVAATVVENTINALPSVDELTLDDRSAVEAARSAYDSLTASQKAFVDIVYVQKLEALEAKILELDPVKKYTRVTGADQLHVGAEYLITNFNATPSTSNTNTFSTTPTSNNIPGVAVTEMTNGQIIENANYQVLRFGAGEQSSEYALEAVNGTSTGKFLRPGSSSSNFLRYEDTLTTDSSWTIDISSDGTATIVASRSSYTRNIMRYNPNSGSPIFSCYNAGQQAISLWLDERTIPAVKELVTGIEITGPTTVDVAETIQLNATITPENADEHGVVWVSSNTSVATVSTTGVVTGVAEGQTTIRATAIDGSGVYDEHIVTVHDA
ncbi:MAG: Ig-like domain-containing protein, partial [Erysipelotrichaceae bacterium]|nr:Ig-like domain-containing protein [Erysipelotrichaceae bacterium]